MHFGKNFEKIIYFSTSYHLTLPKLTLGAEVTRAKHQCPENNEVVIQKVPNVGITIPVEEYRNSKSSKKSMNKNGASFMLCHNCVLFF